MGFVGADRLVLRTMVLKHTSYVWNLTNRRQVTYDNNQLEEACERLESSTLHRKVEAEPPIDERRRPLRERDKEPERRDDHDGPHGPAALLVR